MGSEGEKVERELRRPKNPSHGANKKRKVNFFFEQNPIRNLIYCVSFLWYSFKSYSGPCVLEGPSQVS